MIVVVSFACCDDCPILKSRWVLIRAMLELRRDEFSKIRAICCRSITVVLEGIVLKVNAMKESSLSIRTVVFIGLQSVGTAVPETNNS